jgi:nitric oxide reductase NorD protein
VRTLPCAEGDPTWAARVLCAHAGLLRQLRAQAERLQPRPQMQPRQPLGSEIDVDAYVEHWAELRAGGAPADRLYRSSRRARRECALALLLDVSASTDRWTAAGRRVVDFEREAALLFSEATHALGDRRALYAFASRGPEDVRVHRLQRFGEVYGPVVQRRIAALEPTHCTRLGAALRHITAELVREPALLRAILVLSDGRPSDDDGYGGAYGFEDTRRAVHEALAQGVRPFCLCIDPEAERDPAAIFGLRGQRPVRDLASLARDLADLYSSLIP